VRDCRLAAASHRRAPPAARFHPSDGNLRPQASPTLSLTGRDGHDGRMPPSTAVPARQKKTPGSPAKVQRRPRSGNSRVSAGGRPGGWRVWPVVAAAVVFLIAYILDPGAVVHLVGACLAGQFGPRVRIVTFGALVLVGCVLAWALFRPQPRQSVAAVSKPRRPRHPGKAKPPSAGSEEAAPADKPTVSDEDGSRPPGRRASSRRPPSRT
jgi:hypothetical protein